MPRITEDIEWLDATLCSRSRDEAALRLRLGQALEVLCRGGVHTLGFSSWAAYALERCDRSVRWAEAARCLARRLEGLPELRRAMATGELSWSMGDLLARVAQSHDEAHWLAEASSRTVRQMRVLVANALAARRVDIVAVDEAQASSALAEAEHDAGRDADGDDPSADGDAMCTLTCTVAQEDAWLFEATRALLGHMGVRAADAQCEALLAEAQDTLLGALPNDTVQLDLERLQRVHARQQRWRSELGRWRFEAEALCEPAIVGHPGAGRPGSRAGEAAHHAVATLAAAGMASLEGTRCDELDAHVRDLAAAVARHELELSRLILRFHRANGWRRLGYATETQYARERLGIAISALLARRSLALRLEKLPRVAEALGAGHIGVEAALQVVRVATATTEAAWVDRARQRTIKHLREEVAAALVAVRCSGEADCPPPTDGDMAGFHELEQAVVSGRLAGHQAPVRPADVVPHDRADAPAETKSRLAEPVTEARRAWCLMLASLTAWLEGGLQMSATSARSALIGPTPLGQSAGRVTLRLRMSRETSAWWRALEAQARRWLGNGVSWVRFMCLSLWQAWRHLLGADVAYGRIYIRDRYCCTSPVCSRRDVTPHHLRFRSAGGGDEDENVTSVCTWCHLFGVHGGCIRAAGRAPHIRWELGPPGSPCLVVHGRDRLCPVS